jgi:phosphate transport system permease protein
LSIATLTQMTLAPNEPGGITTHLRLFSDGDAATFAVRPRVMAGIYLAEYNNKVGSHLSMRFVNDILLSAPSVIGLFVYTVVVSQFKSYSGWAVSWLWRWTSFQWSSAPLKTCSSAGAARLRGKAYAPGTPGWKVI